MAETKTPKKTKPAVKVAAPKKTAIKAAPKAAVKPIKASYLDVPVYSLNGKALKTVSLPKEVFGVEAKPELIAQYVRVYRTNLRQGNAATKTRAEVRGSTKKIFRQKGTGRARHGSKKAPIFVGGGITFGPQPREISLKINKKQKHRAFLGILSLKAKDHAISLVSDSFLKMEPKTKLMAGFFKSTGMDNDSILLVFPKMEKNNLMFASRNLPNIHLASIDSLNAFEILKYKKLMLVEEALTKLTSLVAKQS